MLTPKGEFALELINQGQNPTLREIDLLWTQMHLGENRAKSKPCPTCNGAGIVWGAALTNQRDKEID